MNSETEEEKEIELEKRNVHLISEVSPFHPQVGADMFVDGPCEFVIQFPREETHGNRREHKNAGDGDQERPRFFPDGFFDLVDASKVEDGLFDLIQLDSAIDQQTSIIHAESKNLNGIFQSKGIPDEDQLVEEPEAI